MFFVTGDLNIDATTIAPVLSPAGKETQAHIAVSCGGQGGNVAFFLHCLGQPVRLFGTLGRDIAGDLYATHLAHLGITYAGDRVDTPTGMVSVVQEAGSYHMYRQRGANGVADPVRFAAFLRHAAMTPGSCTFVSGYSLLSDGRAELIAGSLAKPGRLRTVAMMDPSSIDAMRSAGRDAVLTAAGVCDYLLPNEEEACWLAQESDPEAAAHALCRLTGSSVVVKLGEQGALLCSGGEIRYAPGIPVVALDATGAGDAFAAAFLTAIHKHKREAAALDAAVAFSAAKVQYVGTQPPELRRNHQGGE